MSKRVPVAFNRPQTYSKIYNTKPHDRHKQPPKKSHKKLKHSKYSSSRFDYILGVWEAVNGTYYIFEPSKHLTGQYIKQLKQELIDIPYSYSVTLTSAQLMIEQFNFKNMLRAHKISSYKDYKEEGSKLTVLSPEESIEVENIKLIKENEENEKLSDSILNWFDNM